jgi:hypothetical protein
MESWRHAWRNGVQPLMSTKALEALKRAIKLDSPELLQGATTSPPPLRCVQDWPVEGACLIAFAGWQGEGLTTVADVEEYFARICFDADERLGEPAACRWILNHYDDTPRYVVFEQLLEEIEAELHRRKPDYLKNGESS